MATTAPTTHAALLAWVDETAKLTKPDKIVWCDGSEAEKKRFTEEAVAAKVLIPLDQKKWPGCYYHHSSQTDVARVEHLTVICTPTKEEAGPTNNWMAPAEAYAKLSGIFDGSMKGRTMYVVPYIMGPATSPFSKVGVELTDSVYVALNMQIMTRMGKVALDRLGAAGEFNKGLHWWPTATRTAAGSATSPRTTPSGRSARATAATPCSGRSAWPSASAPTSPRTRAGWPSTCSSWRPRARPARSSTWRRPSRRPAARPTSP
jgi:GTP-dependent phosphoenolpyruvate carboxykinase